MGRKIVYILCILVVLFGVIMATNALSQKSENQIEVKLETTLPSAPSKVTYYKVVSEDRKFYASPKMMKPKKFVPSKDVAIKIAEEYLSKNGGLPKDAVLKMVETVTLKALNVKTGEIVAERPLCVDIKYKRVINGHPVIGPCDEIELSIGENEVIYFSKLWRKLEPVGAVEIISAEDALSKLKSGEIINKPMYIQQPITVHDVKLGYYATIGKQDFYTPVWIFYCKDGFGNNLTLAVNAVKY